MRQRKFTRSVKLPAGQVTPLEFLLSRIADAKVPAEKREELARFVMPYVHAQVPKLRPKRERVGRPPDPNKAPKPVGKKERLNHAAKTAEKGTKWSEVVQ